MVTGKAPTLFVSSTCYDLSQVRVDIHDFAQSLGLAPILSEFPSFPVNSSVDAVSNCLENVRCNADIFVLIVGGRYGYVTDTGLSVTNLEFIEACAKAIPVFVFVKKDVLTLLPAWKANPNANLAHVVDSTKVFEFVQQIMEQNNRWVFPFNNAQEICSALKQQFGYLFSDLLKLRQKLDPPDPVLSHLGPASLRSYLEKQEGWEFFTLANCLREEVETHRAARMDLDLGLSVGPTVHLTGMEELGPWFSRKLNELEMAINNLNRAFARGLVPAVGPKGFSGNIERIFHLAERVGQIYRSIVEWALEFFRISGPSAYSRLFTLMAELPNQAIDQIETFVSTLSSRIQTSLSQAKQGEEPEFTLTITLGDTSALFAEFHRIRGAE